MSESTQPAWRKRPTCPGIWVCVGELELDGKFVVLRLSQDDLDRGSPFRTSQVYGPISEPEIDGDA